VPVAAPACAALYGASIAALLLSHWGDGWGFIDLSVYRSAGQAVIDARHLYDLRFPGALAFTYPPFAALLFTPLAAAPLAVLEPLITAASLVLLPVVLWLALRLAPVRERLSSSGALVWALGASALALWLEPVWTTLRYGQIDLLVAALVLWDLSRPDSSRVKGVGIGLASALKLTPAIFAVYLLLSRRVRAAGVAAGVFCASVVVAFASLPRDSRDFWGGDFLEAGRVGRVENAANQSLRGMLARLAHTTDVRAIWLCSAALVGVAGMALAVASARRGEEARGFSLCALTGLLVSPISWSHHWALAVPALMLLAIEAQRRGSSICLAACALAAASAFAHVIWWVPVDHPRHSELHLDLLQLLLADAYVIAALGALVLAARASLGGAAAQQPLGRRAVPRSCTGIVCGGAGSG
jgi:alpha-1,2-mannosyltransferase